MMPDIIVTKDMLDGDPGRRFLMAQIAAIMLFPDKEHLKRRMGIQNALTTQLNLDFYRAHTTASLSGDILIGMLEHAALADMSLLKSDIAGKQCKIGAALGLSLEKMLYEAVQAGEPVPFWNEKNMVASGNMMGAVSEKTLERNVKSFRPVLHMWAAAMRIVWERKEQGLTFDRIPCEVGELEKFFQYSAAYLKAGEIYKQKHSSHMFFDGEKCFRFNLEGFELPETIFTNERKETSVKLN